MFIFHNIISFSNYEKFMNRMLRNLYIIKPGMFTNSITIHLCLTNIMEATIIPCRATNAYHKKKRKTARLFREQKVKRDSVRMLISSELEVAAAMRAKTAVSELIAFPRSFYQACLFRRKLDHPVFTLDFATVFFFTEQGCQPCVQPQSWRIRTLYLCPE
jgi:hypothetical protein